jgi:hypothetical protein
MARYDESTPKLRDWLGWALAVIMTVLTSLGGRVLFDQDRRITELSSRLMELERMGTPQMRADMAAAMVRIDSLQLQVDTNTRNLEYVMMQWRRGSVEPNALTPSTPRFSR